MLCKYLPFGRLGTPTYDLCLLKFPGIHHATKTKIEERPLDHQNPFCTKTYYHSGLTWTHIYTFKIIPERVCLFNYQSNDSPKIQIHLKCMNLSDCLVWVLWLPSFLCLCWYTQRLQLSATRLSLQGISYRSRCLEVTEFGKRTDENMWYILYSRCTKAIHLSLRLLWIYSNYTYHPIYTCWSITKRNLAANLAKSRGVWKDSCCQSLPNLDQQLTFSGKQQ